jgi:hypothetical protein
MPLSVTKILVTDNTCGPYNKKKKHEKKDTCGPYNKKKKHEKKKRNTKKRPKNALVLFSGGEPPPPKTVLAPTDEN